MDQGATAAAAALNITESREINNADVNVQKGHVENAPNLGIDGITMVAATEGSEIDLLRLVNRLKIPTVNNHTKAVWNTPLDIGDYYVAFHAPANVTATRARTAQVFEKLGGKGNVVYIEGILGNPVEAERGHGFDLALKDYPGIKLVARRPGGWSRTTTAPVIADILTAHSDIDAIIVSNDNSAIAVVSALEQRKIKALVSGCDAIKEMVALVAQGKAFNTYAYGPSWLGAYSTVVVFDYLNGWRPSVPERMMIFGGYIIDTPEAAKKYQVVVDGPKSPYEFLKMSKVLHPDDWNPEISSSRSPRRALALARPEAGQLRASESLRGGARERRVRPRHEALRRPLLDRSRAERSGSHEQQGPDCHWPILSRRPAGGPRLTASLASRELARTLAESPR